MKITHLGHACVVAEIPGPSGTLRVLVDPGAYSTGFDELRDLDLVLLTHSHPDHLDPERTAALLAANPDAAVVVGAGSAAAVERLGFRGVVHVVASGDHLDVGGLEIEVTGGTHACIHADLPASDNVGYLVAGLYHPGDGFDVPEGRVDVLLVPIGGPWMKVGESIDFLRAIAPRYAVPVHQAGLAPVHQTMHCGLLSKLGPDDTEVVVLEPGVEWSV